MTVGVLTKDYKGIVKVINSTTGSDDFMCEGDSAILNYIADLEVVEWESFTSTTKRGIIIKCVLTKEQVENPGQEPAVPPTGGTEQSVKGE